MVFVAILPMRVQIDDDDNDEWSEKAIKAIKWKCKCFPAYQKAR